MARLRRERRVQRDEVGLTQQLVERDQLDRMRRREGLVGQRIGRQHPHVERAAAARHRLADPAEADDAHAASPEPRMEAAAPAPACDPGVVRQQLEREADRQREGVVGDALVVGAERHGHGDVVSRRGGDVDPVVADAEAGHDPKLRRRGEHPLGVELAARDGRDRARQALDQLGLAQQPVLLVHHDVESGLAQRREKRCRSAVELLDVAEDLAQGRWLPDHVCFYDTTARPIHYCSHRGIAK